jgi:hypothetical protein
MSIHISPCKIIRFFPYAPNGLASRSTPLGAAAAAGVQIFLLIIALFYQDGAYQQQRNRCPLEPLLGGS